MRQQWAQRVAREKTECEQCSQAHVKMFWIVGGVGDTQHKDQRSKGTDCAGRVDSGQMQESSDRCAGGGGSETRVHLRQMVAHLWFTRR